MSEFTHGDVETYIAARIGGLEEQVKTLQDRLGKVYTAKFEAAARAQSWRTVALDLFQDLRDRDRDWDQDVGG